MTFRDSLDLSNPGSLGNWPTLKGVSRPKAQAPASASPQEDAPIQEMIQANTPRADSTEENSKATLSDPKWVEPDTLFHQEAEVTAKLTLPEGKEHLTRVQVELFAKTAKGPESICKVEAYAQPDGNAVARFPVYKPKAHDERPVKYFFEVTHERAKLVDTEGMLRKVS
jgi:hypothetical protein